MFALAPLLWGAGIGALGGLLTGKDPLKGALVGGATGGLLGGLPAGAWAGGAAEATKTAGLASGLGSAAGGTGVAIGDIAASSALPTAMQGSGLASGISSGGAGINLAQGATDMAYGFNPVAQGAGMGSINDLASYSTGSGYDLMAKQPTMFDQISPYLNVNDISGAAQVASQFQPRQQQMQAPSGRVSEGRAPQGTDVTALLQSIKQPERRRITLL